MQLLPGERFGRDGMTTATRIPATAFLLLIAAVTVASIVVLFVRR
jgi:hypothetical protein